MDTIASQTSMLSPNKERNTTSSLDEPRFLATSLPRLTRLTRLNKINKIEQDCHLRQSTQMVTGQPLAYREFNNCSSMCVCSAVKPIS